MKWLKFTGWKSTPPTLMTTWLGMKKERTHGQHRQAPRARESGGGECEMVDPPPTKGF